MFNGAKCNLGKVNLALMLPAVSPSLHMICGGAPLEFTGANHIHPCSLVIVAISAFVSESSRIHFSSQAHQLAMSLKRHKKKPRIF